MDNHVQTMSEAVRTLYNRVQTLSEADNFKLEREKSPGFGEQAMFGVQ